MAEVHDIAGLARIANETKVPVHPYDGLILLHLALTGRTPPNISEKLRKILELAHLLAASGKKQNEVEQLLAPWPGAANVYKNSACRCNRGAWHALYQHKCCVCKQTGHLESECVLRCTCRGYHRERDHKCSLCGDPHFEGDCPRKCQCHRISPHLPGQGC